MDEPFLTLVSRTLKVPVTDLKEDSTTDTLPQWTSLSHWELIQALEDAYHLEFTMDEATEFKDLGSLYEILQSKL